jgi:GNAT superfamily N-acetyltransferase
VTTRSAPPGDWPVRVAEPDDRDAVIATVVAAFAEDPAWSHLLGPDYERLAPLFAGALFDQRVPYRTVWMLDDAAAVALWDGPGLPQETVRRDAWAEFDDAADARCRARMAAYDRAVAQVAPDGGYWYLGVLATRPQDRGGGRASAAMAPGLARAAAEGLDACLETSTPGNRAFYQRRGFDVARPVPLPDGPATWWLTRRGPDTTRAPII